MVFSCCCRLIATFDLLLACYDMVFFVVLLRRFIFVRKFRHADLISQIYQIMIYVEELEL